MLLLGAVLSMVWIGASSAAASPACHCEELTVSEAGNAAANGTYTYTPTSSSSWPEYWPRTRLWLGPEHSLGGSFVANWAVVHVAGSTWVAGVVAVFSNGQWAIFYVPDGNFYTHASSPKCPPETGWRTGGTTPAPLTITRTGCLGARIGDVNDDGATNLLDMRLIYTHVLGFSQLPSDMLYWADVDDDGDVDLDDVDAMAEQLIGSCP